jgi:putative oxidoreductase
MAYVIADREALFSIFSDPDKFMAAAPFTFLFASLLVLIFGAGRVSADRALAYVLENKVAKQPERSIAV